MTCKGHLGMIDTRQRGYEGKTLVMDFDPEKCKTGVIIRLIPGRRGAAYIVRLDPPNTGNMFCWAKELRRLKPEGKSNAGQSIG